jgi:hypothetical protein
MFDELLESIRDMPGDIRRQMILGILTRAPRKDYEPRNEAVDKILAVIEFTLDDLTEKGKLKENEKKAILNILPYIAEMMDENIVFVHSTLGELRKIE